MTQVSERIAEAAAPVFFAEEWDADLRSNNPLSFDGYEPPPADEESVRAGLVEGELGSYVLISCDFSKSGGTMGAVAGERIVRAYRRATERGLPVAQMVSSGGARLQEGMVSLVQMARTSSAVSAHRAAGLLSASALRSPTTGGVYASWASQSDVRTASPGAVIGFGGPRVVEQVTGSLPPKTSHTAESAFRHGLIDAITPLADQRAWLEQALGVAAAPSLQVTAEASTGTGTQPSDAWQLLQEVRSPLRPSGLDWAAWLTDSWVELRGSDPHIRAGLATMDGQRLVVIAMDRAREEEAPALTGPAGFRLAQRAIELAGRLGVPLLTIIDTPGADPSAPSEADGLAREIARTIAAMAALPTVSVALCVGEGGSGGAMALAHADSFLMLTGSVFSVIGPEPGSIVLYRDNTRAAQLARDLKISAAELFRMGAIDASLPESVPVVRVAVLNAITATPAGNRNVRVDALTARALAT